MEFSAYAAKETSALIARVVSESSHASLQQVEALRSALDAASKALEAALTAPPDAEAQVSELVLLLAKAATAEGDARLKRLSSEARKITETLRADLEEQTQEKETLAASLQRAQADADALRVEFEAAQQEAALVRQQLTEAIATQQALDAARQEAIAASDEEATARATVEAEAHDLRRHLESALAEAARTVAARDEEASARARVEADLNELQHQLDATRAEAERALAAGDEHAGARASVEAELESLRGQLEDARAEAARTTADLESVRLEAALTNADLESVREAAARTTAYLESIKAEAALTAEHLEAAKAEAARAHAELEIAAADKASVQAALAAASTHAETVEGKVTSSASQLKASTARVKALEREQAESAETVRDLEARLQTAESEASTGGPAAALPLMDSLLRGLEGLSSAATIDDVLTTLIEQMAAEFPRVALFRVKGNRLEGAHQIGFALNNDIGKVMIPLAMDSVLTRAVSSGRTERVSGDDLLKASGLPFGGEPVWALAAPIVVDGESLAVVYADDSGQSRPERQPAADDMNVRFAEALRQHAIAHLLRLTRELKSQAELRAYAGSLFDEILKMYQMDAAAGKTGNEIQQRLYQNLDYARSIFANRTAYESPVAAKLLEAQLAGMLDIHRDSAFGRDLATIAGWADSSGARRAAEAS